IATPEKVAWIRLRTGRDILESLDHLWRERHIDRRSGFGLVEHQAIAVQPIPLKSDRVANAESAPAHQQGHGAEAGPVVLYWNDAASLVSTPGGRVKYSLKLVAREVVGRDLHDFDFAQPHCWILADVA